MTDPFFALDNKYRFTYLNERAEALLEHPQGELLGQPVWSEFAETVEAQFPDTFYRAVDDRVPVSFDLFHTRLETWFEARVYPSTSGVSVFMRDVTDRKRRETRHAQNAAVVDAIEDCVVVLDNGNRVVSVNPSFESTFDVEEQSLLGEHVDRLPTLAAIDPQQIDELRRAVDDVAVGAREDRELEVQFTDATGDDRIGNLTIVPIEDERANVAGIVRDVTDRRSHERIVESLHELTRWLVETDDPTEICSIAVHAGSDLLELPISGIWLLDDTYGYLEPVAGTARAHDEFDGLPRFYPGEGLVWDAFETGETRYYDDLGSMEGVYNSETPLRSEIIAPIGTHGVLMTGSFERGGFGETDISLISTLSENTAAALDRAEQDRLLRERSDELERQTDRLEAVAEILSSELKTQVDRIDDALATEDDQTTLQELQRSESSVQSTLNRIQRLVDDVREFARNASSVGTRERVTLESAIEEATDRSEIESDGFAVEPTATVRVDQERFVRLLEAVFDDLKSRSPSSVEVTADVIGTDASTDRSRGFYLLSDGSTERIPEHERPFDPRSTADPSTGGLGLALARAIAEAHDWTVETERNENGKLRVEFRDVTTLEICDR